MSGKKYIKGLYKQYLIIIFYIKLLWNKKYYYSLMTSFKAVLSEHICLGIFISALRNSIKRLFSDGILEWDERPSPTNYEGLGPALYKPYIESLIRNKKVSYDYITVDLNFFLPTYKYNTRKELLINYTTGRDLKSTYLYRKKGKNRVKQILLLYDSIKTNGLKEKNSNLLELTSEFPPCYIEMPGGGIRIDGTNRASVLKFLGYSTIKALRIKSSDLFQIELEGDYRNTESQSPVRADIIKQWFKMYNINMNYNIKYTRNVFSSSWYQDIEIAPGIYTNVPKKEQTGLWKQYLPDLSGRKMIDLGSNCGNYSFCAIDKGAKEVLGFEIDRTNFERANFIRDLRIKQGYPYQSIKFLNMDILKDLDVIANYDTFNACNVLYLLGPAVHKLMEAIQNSKINLLFLQGQLKRKNRIGEYNRPGVKGFEKDNKTWGNILGTVEGLTNIAESYGFIIKNQHYSRNWPLLIAER